MDMGNRQIEQNSPEFNKKRVTVPSREGVVSVQLDNLLGAANLMLGFLDRVGRGEPLDATDKRPDLDGGVKCQVEVTAIGILDRIDRLVKDDHAWGVAQQKEAHDATMAMFRRNTELLEISAQATKLAMTPHARLRPQLMRHPEEGWMAALGDLRDESNLIVGYGASPEGALEDFDRRFAQVDARIFEHLKPQIEKREQDLKAGVSNPTPAVIEDGAFEAPVVDVKVESEQPKTKKGKSK